MKKIITFIIIIAIIGLGIYFWNQQQKKEVVDNNNNQNTGTTKDPSDNSDTSTTTDKTNGTESILGKSAGGRDIPIYSYGDGDDTILLVAGIHGAYSWNTSLLAQELMDYLESNPNVIPNNVKVDVVPVLNPDGLSQIAEGKNLSDLAINPPALENTINGRFNSNDVDLNRNFDCNWKATGIWQNRPVSGGSEPFSEPEAQAIKNYVETERPLSVIVWYSAAGGVFSSSCNGSISSETKTITNVYGEASGYPTYDEFNAYEVNGDMANWLAKMNIPTISVLLSNHEDIELDKNIAGVEQFLANYKKSE